MKKHRRIPPKRKKRKSSITYTLDCGGIVWLHVQNSGEDKWLENAPSECIIKFTVHNNEYNVHEMIDEHYDEMFWKIVGEVFKHFDNILPIHEDVVIEDCYWTVIGERKH